VKDSRGRPFQPSAEPPMSSVPPWFLELYPNAFRGLTSNAMLIGATLEEAQDAAQAALTDLLDRVMRGTVIHHPYAYARTAMWRYFVSQRERDRKQIQNLIQRGYTSPEACNDPAMTTWEESEVLKSLLADLPPAQCAVMRFALEGFSITEIALGLGKSSETVRKNLQLARAKLRERYSSSQAVALVTSPTPPLRKGAPYE
jgi:RNA polymerase sigma factor (sigma-70 family)